MLEELRLFLLCIALALGVGLPMMLLGKWAYKARQRDQLLQMKKMSLVAGGNAETAGEFIPWGNGGWSFYFAAKNPDPSIMHFFFDASLRTFMENHSDLCVDNVRTQLFGKHFFATLHAVPHEPPIHLRRDKPNERPM